MPKTKKRKLMPVKEVRELAARQSDIIQEQRLALNDLANQVESLEGARRNLRMMYDTHEAEKQKAIHEKISVQADMKALSRELEAMSQRAAEWRNLVSLYDNEKPFAMWIRSMSKALLPVTKPIKSFIERVKYHFRRGRG